MTDERELIESAAWVAGMRVLAGEAEARYAGGEDPLPLLAELWNRRAELEARKPLPGIKEP